MFICKSENCKRSRNKKEAYCYKCLHKRRKELDPIKVAYRTLKSNAKRRGKEFTITLEYFKKFATKVDYIAKKGITAESYHVDRIDENKGYVPGNLAVLTNSENVKKYLKWHEDHRGRPVDFLTVKSTISNSDGPF